MKICCPHCGIKGSVDDSLTEKKLRCPKCSKVFLITADMLPPSGNLEPEMPEPPQESTTAARNEQDKESATVPDSYEDDEELQLSDEENELVRCSECGQEFSPEFLAEINSRFYCALCEPSPESDDDLLTFDDNNAGTSDKKNSEDLIVTAKEKGAINLPAAENLQKCTKCGEFFSPEFLETVDGEAYCALCSPENNLEPLEISDETDAMNNEKKETSDARPNYLTPAPETIQETENDSVINRNVPDFGVFEVLKEAWGKTYGVKGTFWAALTAMYLIILTISIGGSLACFGFSTFSPAPSSDTAVTAMTVGTAGVSIVLQLLISLAGIVFTGGLMLIGINHICGRPTSWKSMFLGFSRDKIIPVTIAALLQFLLVAIGFILLIIPGIYLSVAYAFTLPLILDRGLDPWEALETSRKTIHKRWWTVFATYLLMGLLYMISAIPLGIGLIWTIPMFFVMIGVLYVRFYGCSGKE